MRYARKIVCLCGSRNKVSVLKNFHYRVLLNYTHIDLNFREKSAFCPRWSQGLRIEKIETREFLLYKEPKTYNSPYPKGDYPDTRENIGIPRAPDFIKNRDYDRGFLDLRRLRAQK